MNLLHKIKIIYEDGEEEWIDNKFFDPEKEHSLIVFEKKSKGGTLIKSVKSIVGTPE